MHSVIDAVNLQAPAGKRDAMNEHNSGAFGIPECMTPAGGGTFAVINTPFH